MRILPMGMRAVLVDEIGDDPAAWAQALRALGLSGVVDIVPAAHTVLIDCVDQGALTDVRARLTDVRPQPAAAAVATTVEIPVRYDGEDLEHVARTVGVAPADLIAIHTEPTYRVAFCGFAPGFAYLSGTDGRLHLARRGNPRTLVPAGSVAVAAGFTAVYPRTSPGGWHLLGRTDAVMFDPDRASPALLEPGTPVRFVAL